MKHKIFLSGFLPLFFGLNTLLQASRVPRCDHTLSMHGEYDRLATLSQRNEKSFAESQKNAETRKAHLKNTLTYQQEKATVYLRMLEKLIRRENELKETYPQSKEMIVANLKKCISEHHAIKTALEQDPQWTEAIDKIKISYPEEVRLYLQENGHLGPDVASQEG